MRLLFSTGEVSGDVAGALLAARILERHPDTEIAGIGGARMAAAGVRLVHSTSHLGTVGVTEALGAVPELGRAVSGIRRLLRESRPDAAVLVGNDVFNTLLARWLRSKGIPTLSYFPPQVWIWKAVAPLITRSFDAVLTSFPEEHAVYARAGSRTGTSVTFVGHYLCERLPWCTPEQKACSRRGLGLSGEVPVVALLPGSRRQEVDALADFFLRAAAILAADRPTLRFVLPVAESSLEGAIRKAVDRHDLAGKVALCTESHEAMRAADVVALASGTASLEAALLGVPTVIAYTVSALTLQVIRAVIRLGLIESETVGLPNLILHRPVVPELRQAQASARSIAWEIGRLLDDAAARETMREALREVGERVSRPASLERAAEITVALARGRPGRVAAGDTEREPGQALVELGQQIGNRR